MKNYYYNDHLDLPPASEPDTGFKQYILNRISIEYFDSYYETDNDLESISSTINTLGIDHLSHISYNSLCFFT